MNNKQHILRTPDAAEGTIVDPLDVQVNDVNTDYPVLKAKVYPMRIDKCEITPTKESAAGNLTKGDVGYSENLVFTLATTEETEDVKENKIPPGHAMKHYVSLTPKDARKDDAGKDIRAYTNEDIKKGVSAVAKSAGIADTVRALVNNPTTFVGKTVRVNLGIQPETKQYPASNKVKSFEVVK